MTCDNAFNSYYALDKNQNVPLPVVFHLLTCPVCRTSVRTLTKAEKLLAQPLKIKKPNKFQNVKPVSDPTIDLVIARIKSTGNEYPNLNSLQQTVTMGPWLFSGLVLIGGFTFFPFSPLGQWAHSTFGLAFTLPFNIVGGIALTIYVGMFIGGNIDFFIKKFGFN